MNQPRSEKQPSKKQPEVSAVTPTLFTAVLAISLPAGITRADRRRVAEVAPQFRRL